MTTDPNDPTRPQVPPADSPPPFTPPASTPPPATTPPPVSTPPVSTPPASTPPPTTPPASTPAGPPMPQFDRSKLSTGDLIFCGGTVLYLIAMIFSWASIDVGVGGLGSISISGFDVGRIVFALVLLVVASVLVALPALGTNIALPVPRSLILLVVSGVVVLITFTAFIDIVTDDIVSTGFGAILGMFVALGLLAQAVLTFRAERGRATV